MTNTKLEELKYQQLRKAIISAVPDIVALKMGCVIMFAEKGILFRAAIYQQNYAGNYLIETIGEATTTIKRNQIKEIIGRDITLEDCLTVIEKDSKFQDGDEQKVELFVKILSSWTLNKPLHQQEQETIEFLWDLICKK